MILSTGSKVAIRKYAKIITNKIVSYPEKMLSKAIIETIEGFSPIVGREIAYRTVFGDKHVGLLLDIEKERLENSISRREKLLSNEGYINKAPQQIVENEKNSLLNDKKELEIIIDKLK